MKSLVIIDFDTESQTTTGIPVLHVRSLCRSRRSYVWMAPVALPDPESPSKRPDGADRWSYPSVRLTLCLLLLSPAEYGLTNRYGVKSVVFIGVETE